MFRPVRWRNDRTRTKAVFKLQFHATQVPQLWADALMVSIVPGDSGKATVRLKKAVIRDGSCKWDSPVFETVKFTRDPKTGKVHERPYHFILSTRSGKSSVVGEASLDFADYAGATKAYSVSLPIKGSDTKAFLNVLIDRLQDNVDQREAGEDEDGKAKVPDRSLRSQLRNSSGEDNRCSSSSTEDVRALIHTIHNAEEDGKFSASSGSDLTTSSESSSGLNTPREKTSDGAIALSSTCQDIKASDEVGAGSELEELRSKLSSLVRQLNLSELELQMLRKQIVKESRRAQELSKEVLTLKEDRNSLAEENKQFRAINEGSRDMGEKKGKLKSEDGNLQDILEECRKELDCEKNRSVGLSLQLQKTRESNAKLIVAVRDLEEMLDHKDKKISDHCRKLRTSDEKDTEQRVLETVVKGQIDPKETNLLEQKILDLNGELEIYRRDRDKLEIQLEQLALDYEILKQKHHEVLYKWEQSQIEEQLKLQYECCDLESEQEYMSKIHELESELQMRLEELTDSSITIGKLESNIKRLESELQTRSGEVSDSLATIVLLETNIKKLESDLEKRSEEFSKSLVTISELESKAEGLQSKLQIRTGELSDSLTIISNLKSKVEISKSELERRSNESSDSLAAVTLLEHKIKELEGELMKMSVVLSHSLASRSELETQVKCLGEELESRTQEFENDLEILTQAKVKQEKRAISAEEALQKLRLKHFDTAKRIQEEFKKLAVQMASTLESNERVAIKAVKEADELRKSNERLQLMKDEYEAKMEGISREFQELARKLETEITRLSTDNSVLSARAAEAGVALQKRDAERSELERSMALLKLELEVKNIKVCDMEHGFKILKVHCDELKYSLHECEDEKERLRRELDNHHSSNFVKNPSQKAANCSEGYSSEGLQPPETGKTAVGRQSEQLQDLSTEVSLLRETNESLEIELKDMQGKYSDLSLRFAEVDGHRQKLMMTVGYLKNARKK
ncbi:hypothetical protein SAY87_015187 [Trapa incisa]|uniref:C2 NT-type domain-containing protein n=1 Tax=Trapa incisa TaxID=236973 RepID=A0AAN7GLA1_9MYRT|nr:hypothetical protein SAY87_015187 [Trapa incisa]